MNQGNYDEIIRRLMKKIADLEGEQKRFSLQTKLFTILNTNTPAQFTADQNNYDPGDYDFLRISANASRTVTGISGGVEGRVLYLQNVSGNNIILAHQSASSLAANRISCPGAVNHTMTPNATGTRNRVVLIYASSVWSLFFESAP